MTIVLQPYAWESYGPRLDLLRRGLKYLDLDVPRPARCEAARRRTKPTHSPQKLPVSCGCPFEYIMSSLAVLGICDHNAFYVLRPLQ